MKDFVTLFQNIESTTSTNKKIDFLVEYFNLANDTDKLWVIALFSHKRPKRTVSTKLLREWAAEVGSVPLWLFEESYHIVGDLAETISKIIPKATHNIEKPLSEWIQFLKNMHSDEEDIKKGKIINAWLGLNSDERFLLNKLITGGFRMGVSQRTIVKALSKHLEQEDSIIAHKLMGNWSADKTTFEELLLKNDPSANISKPYPFYLAYPLDKKLEELGDLKEWSAEYKWDGIRGQLIKRKGELFLWSRGEELITHQFPEFDSFLLIEKDFVIDGEVLIKKNNEIKGFNILQKRLGRKKPSKKYLEDYPAILMVYDLLEYDGIDLRERPLYERKKTLKKLFNLSTITQFEMSLPIQADSWSDYSDFRNAARNKKAEGLMLKRQSSPYLVGRKKGGWFKWKLDPMTIDAVLIYAQRGHGRRTNLYTDFTFALKHNDRLLPFAKAYSGLTDDEFREVSRFVKSNTVERFGPVSSVIPQLVFEIGFDSVFASSRHKSGIAVRFPRILRWRKDKTVNQIDNLDTLKEMI